MCRFYHLTDEQLLNMPVKRFWFMDSQIERLDAAEKLRTIPLHQAAASQNGASEYIANLKEALGSTADVRSIEYVTTHEAEKAKLRQMTGKVK